MTAGTPPTVLFVDDDRDTLEMYSMYFEMSGFGVARSTTPGDALSGMADHQPDVVVTDVGFDGRPEGLAFIHALKTRAETQHIPLILLSGRSADQLPAAARAEADLCLVKPVLPDDLLADVQRLLGLGNG